VKKFLRSTRTGFYLAIVKEGEVGAGDAIEIPSRADEGLSIAEFTATYLDRKNDPASIMRVLADQASDGGLEELFRGTACQATSWMISEKKRGVQRDQRGD